MNGGDRCALMRQVQVYSFAVLEVGLFLNTHPCDSEALAYYEKYTALLKETKAAYECKYGPLTMTGVKGETWSWVKEPWPWETEYPCCNMRG